MLKTYNKFPVNVITLIVFTFCILHLTFAFADEFDLELKKVYPKVITPSYGVQDNGSVLFEFSDPLGMQTFSLKIFNLVGNKVREMSDSRLWKNGAATEYYINWDGKDSTGNIVSQGVYIYCFQTAVKNYTGTIIVAR